MASKTVSPEPLGVLQDSDDDDDGNNSSGLEDEDSDEETMDLEENESEDDEQNTPPVKKPQTRSQSKPPPSWRTPEEPDEAPAVIRFCPARPPGVQLNSSNKYTPVELFKLFFCPDAVATLCKNTNKQAARNIKQGRKYKWTDVTVDEFYKYIGLVFYTALIKLNDIRDYWRQNNIFSIAFPGTVMTRDRYRTISWNVHMSDPEEDQENDSRKGTPQHDRLFRVRPLMDRIREACKTFYHPQRNLAVDERMVASKAKTSMKQYMKRKPIKWGFKLFVMADSSNGYTVDFAVYTGKDAFYTGQGISYDTVMSFMDHSFLGSGYHVYMDNFYTSPKLFKDLRGKKFGACGTYRDNKKNCKDCPRTTLNALSRTSLRGDFRWIRDGPLVFVKWMDSQEVSVCSTIHAAFGETIKRKVKTSKGTWSIQTLPCPTPVLKYNEHMGGVDLSNQLIQYYTPQHKTMKWYQKLFLHFLDIAATNAYILHKELVSQQLCHALTHKAFMEELTAQLCGISQKIPLKRACCDHVPVPVAKLSTNISQIASHGRRTCVFCRKQRSKKSSTPWKCRKCDVALCLQLTRNCYEQWHKTG
ncbi:piggyBac transposable element-derived protein 4-like [Clarias gariepinus]|uniref:piggyBac transposable element-derived protein 4-like n=1 Tax=Clarias gariepinus TaxID=13013 RepID=UPI00234C1CB2|nr:piggyBac transposable element-derived protein 4-like [Clarias gariepinus]